MATFHSTDRWFVLGLITIIIHLLLVSGWYNLNHVLFSHFWIGFSVARVLSAILLVVLHSKLSSTPLLLAAALWSLFGLIILSIAINRTYIRVIKVLETDRQKRLRYVAWLQLLPLLAIPFFAASTGCWAHASHTDIRRLFFRQTGRILNWTGGSSLLLGLILNTASGLIIVIWSHKTKKDRPAFLVACGLLIPVPLVFARYIIQMIWMRHRNTLGADFTFHAIGGVTMEITIPIINLIFAWWTFASVNRESFYRAHNIRPSGRRRLWRRSSTNDKERNNEARRHSLVRSAFSAASVSTIASFSRATSFISERKTDRPFPNKFSVRATGRSYRMEDGNGLIRNIRMVHKAFYTKSDAELAQRPFSLNPITIRADAQRVTEQIAKLLWLFTLWEVNGQEDQTHRHIIETDITSVWYEDIAEVSGFDSPRVQVVRPFNEICQVVLGHESKRPQEQMLERVFLHFFDRLRNHDVSARAGVCLLALRLMLKQDLDQEQAFRSCLDGAEEAIILDIDEAMWHKYDELAAETRQR